MPKESLDILPGNLDLLVLRALTWGPRHGYAILAWLRESTGGALRIVDAALYPALHRLEARELIDAEWGLSENNRRARFYRLTDTGRQALRAETRQWNRYAAVVAQVLSAPERGNAR
ncbi:MAG: PadR family transcriptional regulator [Gemmatimonadales bacterium]